MPRQARKASNSIYQHVIVQGINKSYIFDNRIDILHYIKILKELTQECNIELISYCVMSNHTHMLIKTEEIENLVKFMRKANTKYAMYYNRKYNRVGYVFRNRYNSQDITTEAYLYNCIKYIYNNPVKAKICDNPYEYYYSNIKEFTNKYKVLINFDDIEESDDFEFEDITNDVIEDNECEEIINNFLKYNKLKKEYLIKDKAKLAELLRILKSDRKKSLRNISKKLGISRETLRKCIK